MTTHPAGADAAALLNWGFGLSASAGAVGSLVPAPADVAQAQQARAAANAAKANTIQQHANAQTTPGRPTKTPPPGSNVSVQSGFSLGAVGLAGIALLPGRRRPKKSAAGTADQLASVDARTLPSRHLRGCPPGGGADGGGAGSAGGRRASTGAMPHRARITADRQAPASARPTGPAGLDRWRRPTVDRPRDAAGQHCTRRTFRFFVDCRRSGHRRGAGGLRPARTPPSGELHQTADNAYRAAKTR
ncbi:hypothetical protein [Fodinicola feengrottensis]|uniref:hypothetical protein n=1 Tax=Fodinicola feengrottensis TaxID=435914 RepID=UPI0024424C28|nr:hypothetical protein [Fodinicola feengrottensis]